MKELIVNAIENGTVIDHIPCDSVFKVIKILNLEASENMLLFGNNLESKKYGKKGIVKVKDKYFKKDEINKIALVAPAATLILIKDYKVTEKNQVQPPETVEGIVKCFNPNCITNHENVVTRFSLIDAVNI
ncbi:MAG: aspartate carbamoyltransferase regulatory subunit, partial [Bacteroidota bacterium]